MRVGGLERWITTERGCMPLSARWMLYLNNLVDTTMGCGSCKDAVSRVYVTAFDDVVSSFLVDEGFTITQVRLIADRVASAGSALVMETVWSECEPFVDRAMGRLVPIKVNNKIK